MRKFLLILTLPALLSGCVAAAVGAGTETGVSLAEERSLGSKIDDSVIYTDISNRLIQKGTNKLYLKVTVRVRNARVMLTGIVQTEDAAQQAVSLAWQAKGVEEVINELIIAPDNSYTDATGDSLIKKNLESRLLFTKDVWVINYSIDVVNGTAYLLGKVLDRAELNRVMNVARTTKGIKRVVSHLQIKSETAADGSNVPPPTISEPPASYNAPVYENKPYYNNSAAPATDGTISTDSVSSSSLPPAGGY
jgi:osmotically-inducible protein OsmY